jgi:hypothetical protein
MDMMIEKYAKKIQKILNFYTLGLIRTPDRKSLTNIAATLAVAHDKLQRILCWGVQGLPVFPYLQESLIHYYSKKSNLKGFLLIDETIIPKVFSRVIEGAYKIYNTVTCRKETALCIAVIAWSNGTITIPIRFAFVHSKKGAPQLYKTKSKVAIELIEAVRSIVPFAYILADGAYSTREMLEYLSAQDLPAIIKARSNYVVTDQYGRRLALKNLPLLKLLRNKRSKRIRATWYGMKLYFSVHKRKNKHGEYSITYLVSTVPLKAKEYIELYENRWEIEKMFRTMKQKLGLTQCSARKFDHQQSHFTYVFFSYSFLQHYTQEKKLENADDSVKALRQAKSISINSSIASFTDIFHAVA